MNLFEAIVNAIQVKAHEGQLSAAKILEAAIIAEIVRLMDERADDAYLASVMQPAPTPAFAVGTRVQNIEGDMTGTVVSVDNEGFEVLFDGRAKPNRFRLNTKFVTPLEPLPVEPPALPEGVTREKPITLLQEGAGEHTTVSSEIAKDNRKVFLSVANGVEYMNMDLTPGQARLLGKKLIAYADWIDANEQREANEYREDFNDD